MIILRIKITLLSIIFAVCDSKYVSINGLQEKENTSVAENSLKIYNKWKIKTSNKTVEGCPSGFIENIESGTCYNFIRRNVTWYEANIICNGFPNTSLAEIQTHNEHIFLVTNIQADSDLNKYHFWIGGNDLPSEGTWWWTGSGNIMNYSNWHPGEPNNSGGQEHCLMLAKSLSFMWNDSICPNKINAGIGIYGICETINPTNMK